jgi:membrane protein DedA with SNARE-associated domain
VCILGVTQFVISLHLFGLRVENILFQLTMTASIAGAFIKKFVDFLRGRYVGKPLRDNEVEDRRT